MLCKRDFMLIKRLCLGVVTIKLTNGEELVARLVEEQEHYYQLLFPMLVIETQSGATFTPYLITAAPNKSISLPKIVVSVITETDNTFVEKYLNHCE